MSRAPVRSYIQARDPSVDRRDRPRPLRQVNLEDLIAENECEIVDGDTSGSDSNSDYESEVTGSTVSCTHNSNSSINSDGALVYLRLRPIGDGEASSAYTAEGNVLVTRTQADKSAKNMMEKHFTFTDIMDGAVKQSKVYDVCMRRSIETEENLTILTYGTSGSGKTFTQIGDFNNPGMIPRALEHIFAFYGSSICKIPGINVVNGAINFMSDEEIATHDRLHRKILAPNDTEIYNHDRCKSCILNEHKFKSIETKDKAVLVWVSFAEIYNEVVYDLLNPSFEQQLSRKKGLTIVSNKGRVFIKNLTSVCIKNSFEAYLLLRTGSQRVTFGSTAVNNHSSRSHFVFFVDVVTCLYPDITTYHSYKFCDLAGSERLDKTKNVGSRLKEAQRINKSLLALGRCLDTVYHNQEKKNADVVPFRESKLTTLLQAPLIGKEKMTMIVNINPTDDYYEENLHVLAFSSIAKNIVFKEKPKKEVKRSRYSWLAAHPPFASSFDSGSYEPFREEIKMLNNKVESLTNEISRLERVITSQETELRKQMIEEYETRMLRQKETWEKRLEMQKVYYEERIRSFESQLRRKRKSSSIYVSVSDNDEPDSDSR